MIKDENSSCRLARRELKKLFGKVGIDLGSSGTDKA
jgi:hypothetical protein